MKELGITVRHLDAHGHVHKAAIVPCALRRVLGEFGIATVRRTQNLFYRRPRFSRLVLQSSDQHVHSPFGQDHGPLPDGRGDPG